MCVLSKGVHWQLSYEQICNFLGWSTRKYLLFGTKRLKQPEIYTLFLSGPLSTEWTVKKNGQVKKNRVEVWRCNSTQAIDTITWYNMLQLPAWTCFHMLEFSTFIQPTTSWTLTITKGVSSCLLKAGSNGRTLNSPSVAKAFMFRSVLWKKTIEIISSGHPFFFQCKDLSQQKTTNKQHASKSHRGTSVQIDICLYGNTSQLHQGFPKCHLMLSGSAWNSGFREDSKVGDVHRQCSWNTCEFIIFGIYIYIYTKLQIIMIYIFMHVHVYMLYTYGYIYIIYICVIMCVCISMYHQSKFFDKQSRKSNLSKKMAPIWGNFFAYLSIRQLGGVSSELKNIHKSNWIIFANFCMGNKNVPKHLCSTSTPA